MAAFRVLEIQFQKFIKPRFSLDDEDGIMTCKYFLSYTGTEVQQFRNTPIKHVESIKKSINRRAQHKREYDSRVNERQMQTIKGKIDTSNAFDANIKPIYDEELMAEVQLTTNNNVFATRKKHSEQPEFNNEGEVDQNAEQCHDTCPLPAKLTDNQTIELSNQSLESKNTCLKKTVAQFQKEFSKLETHCINLELQLQNKVLKSGQQS
ncbi:hypothetical protein Tco_0756829 [Tanacetum coccineum]